MKHVLEEFAEACTAPGAELGRLVNDAMARLGFKAHIYSHGDPGTLRDEWGDFDTAHLRDTRADPSFAADPMALDAIRSWDPVIWDARAYAGSGMPFASLYRRSIAAGYHHGLICQVRGPADYRGMFTAIYDGCDRSLHANRALLSNAMNVIGPWAARASVAARPGPAKLGVALTAREAECLEWALNGKTAWETSHIVGVNTRTVNFHLQNAMRKLGVHNKQQAGRKAMSLGLLNPANVYGLGGVFE